MALGATKKKLPRRACALGVRALCAAVCAVALVGCAAIIPRAPSDIFDLSAPTEVAAPGRGRLQVLVPEPSAIKALDTDRIAARPSPSEYAYLPRAVWSDSLPKLLQARLMETLQNSGRVRAAALPGQGLVIDYQLVVDIRAFELSGGEAVAEFAVKLMDDRTGRVARTRTFRHVAAVSSSEPEAVVAGLNAAMDAAFVEITAWAFGG
jgi:cholesterol transport system auxiliary component